MDNVIEFPDKVFPRWGAIAQALSVYLRHLGATNGESREIIARLQANWEKTGVPLALPALRLIPAPQSDEEDALAKGELKGQAALISRHWKSENARTLLELAKLEYDRSHAV